MSTVQRNNTFVLTTLDKYRVAIERVMPVMTDGSAKNFGNGEHVLRRILAEINKNKHSLSKCDHTGASKSSTGAVFYIKNMRRAENDFIRTANIQVDLLLVVSMLGSVKLCDALELLRKDSWQNNLETAKKSLKRSCEFYTWAHSLGKHSALSGYVAFSGNVWLNSHFTRAFAEIARCLHSLCEIEEGVTADTNFASFKKLEASYFASVHARNALECCVGLGADTAGEDLLELVDNVNACCRTIYEVFSITAYYLKSNSDEELALHSLLQVSADIRTVNGDISNEVNRIHTKLRDTRRVHLESSSSSSSSSSGDDNTVKKSGSSGGLFSFVFSWWEEVGKMFTFLTERLEVPLPDESAFKEEDIASFSTVVRLHKYYNSNRQADSGNDSNNNSVNGDGDGDGDNGDKSE